MYVFKLTQVECNILIKSLKKSLENEPVEFVTDVTRDLINRFGCINDCKVKKHKDKYVIEFKENIVTKFDEEKHKRIPIEFNTVKEAKDYIAKNMMGIIYDIL